MKIGIDLDGTISEYPEFFALMTRALAQAGARVFVITDRPVGTEKTVQRQLEACNLTWHQIVITARKRDFIKEEGIDVLFEDDDRYFEGVSPSVAVFKIRQHYNYDFSAGRWKD